MSYAAVYLNRVHREKNQPEKPEDPLILEKDIPYDADFTFVDFVPSVLSYSAGTHEVEYHRFGHLIETANSWLRRNSHWKVVNCETVRLFYRHNLTSMVSRWEQQISPVTTLWNTQSSREYETALKALRLWVRRKEIDEEDIELMNQDGHFAMSIRHLDFIPQRINGNFETVDNMVQRVNDRLQLEDVSRWSLLALESLKVECNGDWFVDTESSLAEESTRHLTILRLFYEDFNADNLDNPNVEERPPLPSPLYPQVSVEDFKPRHLSGGSFFKRPQFEPFSSLVQRASKWLATQAPVHFMNAQSIDIKVKSLSKLETRTCAHVEHGDYVQILRVVYCKLVPRLPPQPSTSGAGQASRPRSTPSVRRGQLSVQMGTKVILTTKVEHPLDSPQQRIHNWLRSDTCQDVCVLSAETVDIYAKDDDEKNLEKAVEECFQCNRLGSLNAYAFTAIRLFYCVMPEGDRQNSDRPRSLTTMDSNLRRFCDDKGTTKPRPSSSSAPSRADRRSRINNEKSTSSNRSSGSGSQRRKVARLRHQVSNIETTTSSRHYPLLHSQSTRRPTEHFIEKPETLDFIKDFEELRTRSRSSSCSCM